MGRPELSRAWRVPSLRMCQTSSPCAQWRPLDRSINEGMLIALRLQIERGESRTISSRYSA